MSIKFQKKLLIAILCFSVSGLVFSFEKAVNFYEAPVSIDLPFDGYAIVNNREDFRRGSELSAIDFRYIAQNVFRRLPSVGNESLFGGDYIFERPGNKEMQSAKRRMEEESGNYAYRIPCVENLRCFVFGFTPGYWLVTFNAKGEFQDAALIYVSIYQQDDKTKKQLRMVKIATEFGEVDNRLKNEIEDPKNTEIYSGYLDFERLGFFCSQLAYEEDKKDDVLRYRLSRVMPSGRIEVVLEQIEPKKLKRRRGCNIQREKFTEIIQRMTQENEGKNPFGV